MPNVVLYTTGFCPYCIRARNLLSKKGVEFTELRIDKDPSLRIEMENRSQRHTVPQIFIDDYHVGGCDDMIELDIDGKLDGLLGLRKQA